MLKIVPTTRVCPDMWGTPKLAIWNHLHEERISLQCLEPFKHKSSNTCNWNPKWVKSNGNSSSGAAPVSPQDPVNQVVYHQFPTQRIVIKWSIRYIVPPFRTNPTHLVGCGCHLVSVHLSGTNPQGATPAHSRKSAMSLGDSSLLKVITHCTWRTKPLHPGWLI